MEQQFEIIGKVIPTNEGSWTNQKEYDVLSLVTKDNSIYISNKKVPIGVDITDDNYWVFLINGGTAVIKIANSTQIGGITAEEKTDEYKDEVRIDSSTGKLYTKPSTTKLNIASNTDLGGIKANNKTSEYSQEVKIDPVTGLLYIKPFELNKASSTILGGIKAEQKTSKDTVEVKIDSNTGKLYVEPVGEESVTYNYTNYPDNEDLVEETRENEEKVMKLADKEYNAEGFSGLGRVYLRRNISASKNVLTQDMMSKENTRYIIQYDYDLRGATINIPEGCVLDFQGGSLTNGTISSNNVNLNGEISIKGIKIKQPSDIKKSPIGGLINVKWFGAKGDGITDDSNAILEAYNACTIFSDSNATATLYFPAGKYVIEKNGIFSSLENNRVWEVQLVGDGRAKSFLYLKTDGSEKWFYNNESTTNAKTGDFSFENLSLSTDDVTKGNIIKEFSAGTEKRFKFINCNISANNILWTEGSGNADLTLFFNCFIYCYGYFMYLNNPQSVTHRVIACNILTYLKTIIYQKQGGCVYFSQCEIEILKHSTYQQTEDIYIVNAVGGFIGSSDFSFNDCRFELHGKGRICNLRASSAGCTLRFTGCTLIAPNNDGTYFTTISYNKTLIFSQCTISENIKFGIGVDSYSSSTSTSAPLLIIRECDLTRNNLKNQFNLIGSKYRVIVDKCFSNLKGVYGVVKNYLDADIGFEKMTTVSFPSTVKRVFLPFNEANYISTNDWQEASIYIPYYAMLQCIKLWKSTSNVDITYRYSLEIYGEYTNEESEVVRELLDITDKYSSDGSTQLLAKDSVNINIEISNSKHYDKIIIKRVSSNSANLGEIKMYVDYI